VAAFLRRDGGSMLESTASHGRGVEWGGAGNEATTAIVTVADY